MIIILSYEFSINFKLFPNKLQLRHSKQRITIAILEMLSLHIKQITLIGSIIWEQEFLEDQKLKILRQLDLS